MIQLAVLPLVLCMLFETAEHVSYSLAGDPGHRRVRWLATGVGLHLLLLIAWLWLLTILPLGVALPLRGASYITIVLAGRILLSERVGRRCLLGVGTIVVGLALVGAA